MHDRSAVCLRASEDERLVSAAEGGVEAGGPQRGMQSDSRWLNNAAVARATRRRRQMEWKSSPIKRPSPLLRGRLTASRSPAESADAVLFVSSFD